MATGYHQTLRRRVFMSWSYRSDLQMDMMVALEICPFCSYLPDLRGAGM